VAEPASKKTAVAEPEAPVMVRVENVSKYFDGAPAIEGVSFEIRKGEVIGFLGPNGAGKTTTMRVLAGFFPPTEGKVWIGAEDLYARPSRVKRRVGYMPEVASLYQDMTVREFLDFVARVKSVRRTELKNHIEDKISRCGLREVRGRLIGQLSRGYRQRVGLAQALLGEPDVLVLDEPTNGLDPKQIIEIRSLLRELGRERTLVLSTHILPEVQMVCDRVLIMNKGHIVASGTAEELEASLKNRQEIFISMGDRHRKEEALGLLGRLPGVEKVAVVQERNDQVAIALTVSQEQDLRPTLTRLFVRHQIPLLEIRSGRLSLEEIFMKIVVREAGAGGPSEDHVT